ncbi:collagen alpha-6(VI) chain [Elysia marginata]|uniref:Collagen alpha-6(VI) chain n=1 Tax=Elysia marginata TaxID=1093978 RepID=A0AAV4FN76_9GAST|nr:collagen alpha-6(VI) chain [Elysia marginata]
MMGVLSSAPPMAGSTMRPMTNAATKTAMPTMKSTMGNTMPPMISTTMRKTMPPAMSTSMRNTMPPAMSTSMRNTMRPAMSTGMKSTMAPMVSTSMRNTMPPMADTTKRPTMAMTGATNMPSDSCFDKKADVVFLLDASTSEGADNFKKQLSFVKNLVANLNIGPQAVKVGLVTFSDDAHLQFNLDDHVDKSILQLALGFVPYQSGSTNMASGLNYVRMNSFQPAAGGRDDAQRVVVVITDGKADDPQAAYKEAFLLRKNGTIVLTLGIGPDVDSTALANIASSANYTVQAPDFDSLGLSLDKTFLMTCDACEQRAFDMVLLLDTSASEGLTHFQEQTAFAADFVSQFEIGPTKVQVAAATFGSAVYRQFYLNQYDDTTSVVDAIRRIVYTGGTTYTQLALQYVRTNFFADGYGHRKGVPKIVLIATDGRSTNRAETIRQADMLRNEGYIVYAVAIGNNLDLAEVNAIATDPSRVYQVQSFDDLQAFLPTLKSDLCFDCGQEPADVVFVLDSSSSEGPRNFQKQLYFAGNVTRQLAVAPDKVQVALVTFSTTAYNVFYLNRYKNKYDVLDAIARTNYIAGSTHTDEALTFVRLNTLSTLHGRRLQAQPVVIVLTDGQSSLPAETLSAAQLLQGTGATVIAVGIGSNTDDAELSAIASDAAHKFNVNSFDFLFSIQDQIVKETCEG